MPCSYITVIDAAVETSKTQALNQYADNLMNSSLIRYHENGAVKKKALFEKGVSIRSTSYDVGGQLPGEYTIGEQSAENPWLAYLRQKNGV